MRHIDPRHYLTYVNPDDAPAFEEVERQADIEICEAQRLHPPHWGASDWACAIGCGAFVVWLLAL